MGSIVESRFNNAHNSAGIDSVGRGSAGVKSNMNVSLNKDKWLMIAMVACVLELVIVVILAIMLIGREDKVCTIDDLIAAVEQEDSPSENWKIYVENDLDEPEQALLVFSRIADGRQTETDYEDYFELAADYIDLFGGELPSEFDVLSARAFTLEENRFRRALFEVNDGCMRFDFEPDFSVLEKYSFTAGNCDEFGW